MSCTIKGLHVPLGGKEILKGVDGQITPGKHIVLLGANGSGKTTLMKTMSGAHAPTKGRILLDGKETSKLGQKERAKAIAYVPSGYESVFSYNVVEFLLMGKLAQKSMLYLPGENERQEIRKTLGQLGLLHLADQNYQSLSSGEKQLCLVVRGILQNTKLLLLDEPVANLDFSFQHKILEFVTSLSATNKMVMTSLHDPNFALQYADEIWAIHEGRLLACIHKASPHFLAECESVLSTIYNQQVVVKEVDEAYFVQRKTLEKGE